MDLGPAEFMLWSAVSLELVSLVVTDCCVMAHLTLNGDCSYCMAHECTVHKCIVPACLTRPVWMPRAVLSAPWLSACQIIQVLC